MPAVILCEFFNALLVGWRVGVAARIGQSSEMCQAVWGTNSASLPLPLSLSLSLSSEAGQEATQINGERILPAMSIGNDIDSGNDACQI